MIEEKWQRYAKSWSLPDGPRDTALAEVVTDDVSYTDPTVAVSGRTAFSKHMADFQTKVPGSSFEIISASEHHQQSLARWRLVAGDGSEMMQGTSHANLDQEGRFRSFTGFF